MKSLAALLCLLLVSCSSMPQLFQAVDDIETDTALSVELSREAMQKEKNISVVIEVANPQSK